MKLFAIFHKRSLALAVWTLFFTLLALAQLILVIPMGLRSRLPPPTFVAGSVLIFVAAAAILTYGVYNLVKDVERGYSPERCSLAAVVYLGSFLIQGWAVLSFLTSWADSGN